MTLAQTDVRGSEDCLYLNIWIPQGKRQGTCLAETWGADSRLPWVDKLLWSISEQLCSRSGQLREHWFSEGKVGAILTKVPQLQPVGSFSLFYRAWTSLAVGYCKASCLFVPRGSDAQHVGMGVAGQHLLAMLWLTLLFFLISQCLPTCQ